MDSSTNAIGRWSQSAGKVGNLNGGPTAEVNYKKNYNTNGGKVN